MANFVQSSDSCLIIFARLPVPGRVKTRLAATVGPDNACTFYKACAEHAMHVASSSGLYLEVHHSHGDNTALVQEWVHGVLPETTVICPQIETPDLGVKMQHALQQALLKPGISKVLIIGTDIPDISAQVLDTAANALDSHNMVVGPAKDGGYYLLGLAERVETSLFQDMAWSSSSVLSDTLSRAAAAGLTIAPLDTLPKLQDIDTLQDMREWLHDIDSERRETASAAEPASQAPRQATELATPNDASENPQRHVQHQCCEATGAALIRHSKLRSLASVMCDRP